MKHYTLALILPFLAAPLFAQCQATPTGVEITTPGGVVTLAGAGPALAVKGGVPLTGTFFLRDGKTNPTADLALPALGEWTGHGNLNATSTVSGLKLDWSVVVEGAWAEVLVTFTNTGAEQRWLEAGWRVRVPAAETSLFFGPKPSPCSRAVNHDKLIPQFPAAALYDTRGCTAIGTTPDLTLSYLRRTLKQEGATGVLETATRIVVDPGKSERLHFIIAPLNTKWGYQQMLHEYYARFPECFTPDPTVEPRANLGSANYLAWGAKVEPELCRRFHAGWDWCYAPFKRTGDIVGRPEHWDYESVRPMSGDRKAPREQYLAERKRKFTAGQDEANVGMMFYIPSQIWCEERLAREQYSDSLITDKREKTYFDTPWVTGHDNELRVFPLETSFGKQSRLDMAEVARDLPIAGFSFDTAGGGARYYGPAANRCPGRAWDDVGLFVEEAVAIADLMRYVHTLPPRFGSKLAVVSNLWMPAYEPAFACDSGMIEADPTSTETWMAQTNRCLLGHKTVVFWENYELDDLLAADLKPEQMSDALRGLADYTVLSCLKIAAIPTPRLSLGMRKLVEWTPLLTKIAQAGWEPVPAATTDERLFVTRAGKGLGTYLCVGNQTGEQVPAKLAVENRYLGPGSCFFVRHDGRATETWLQGETSIVPFGLQPREPVVWEAAGSLQTAAKGLVSASREATVDRSVLRLHLTLEQATKCLLRLPVPEDMALAEATLEGKRLTMKTEGRTVTTEIALAKGKAVELVVSFRSNVFGVAEEKLLSLPWLQGDRAGYKVVSPAEVASEQAYAARRLEEYIPYYVANALQVTVPKDAPATAPAFEIVPAVAPGAVTPQRVVLDASGKRLMITGQTPADLRDATLKVLSLLDTKFPYAGRLPATNLFRKTGVAGLEIK